MDVRRVYNELSKQFGPQHWWPRHNEAKRRGFDPTWEVLVGCILTQNTAWTNVEKAVANLYAANVLDVRSTLDVSEQSLREYVHPAGYFNQKARKLKIFSETIDTTFSNDNRLSNENVLSFIETISRNDLLAIWGIGPETADSMLLYAGNRPEFVIDAYTKRLCETHGVKFPNYQAYKDFFESQLPKDVALYNEYHALIVAWGKQKKNNIPR